MEHNETIEQVRSMTIQAMDESFVMGMNYQRLTTLELVIGLADQGGFNEEQVAVIANGLGLLKELTNADIPTNSNV